MNPVEKAKKKLQNALKLSGFTVRREFCSLIYNKFQEQEIDLNDQPTFEQIIKSLCSSLENQQICEKSIEQVHIIQAIEACLNAGYDLNETVFNVINAFDFPRLSYNLDRKQYYIDKTKAKLLSEADTKAKFFLERYSTVLQRTKRNFQQKVAERGGSQLKLQTVDYLLTLSYVTLEHTLILGCLFQAKEGKYFLEDPTGMVELDLTHAKYHGGFFVENCFLLANGYYEDKILHVSTIVLPPGEDYKNSRPSFGNLNYFGGLSNVPLRDSQRLNQQMNENRNKNILLFSDVWLDHPMVFEKLQYLFDGFQEMPPIAFVFMGNFISSSHGSEMMDLLKKLLKRFADLVLKYQNIWEHSHFVFVPGLSDPCTPHIAPRFPLPNYVTSEIRRLLPKAIFATNPCRLQYCTREIIIFRADLASKFLQGTLFKPAKDEVGNFVKRTIISQGHLCPFSLNSLTVHWDFDYTLRLYPLPDLIVVGDKAEPHKGSYKECQVVNPGPFCGRGFQFMEYVPFCNTVNDCDLETSS